MLLGGSVFRGGPVLAGSEKMGGKARHRRRESWTTDDDFADDDEQFAARYGDVRRSSSGNVLHHLSLIHI